MSHSLFEERLGPWLDGELTEAASLEVAGHVRECGVCRSRVEEIQRLSSAIRQMERHPMPADLKERLIAGAASHAGTQHGNQVFWRSPWVLASAAAAAGVVIVVLALRPGAEADGPTGGKSVEIAMSREAVSRPKTGVEPPATSGHTTRDAPAAQREPISAPAAPPPRKLTTPQPVVARDQISIGDGGTVREREQANDQMTTRALPAEPEQRAAYRAAASPVARFETHLILRETEAPVLGPIIPAVLDAGSSTAGAPFARERTPNPSAGVTTSTIGSARQEVAPTRMTFLVQLDQDGRALSAEHVGARLVSADRVRMVQALLVASTLPPRAPGEPTLVVVEVLVTEAP